MCERGRESERRRVIEREREGKIANTQLIHSHLLQMKHYFKHIIKTHRNFKIVRVCVSAFKRERERERVNITH